MDHLIALLVLIVGVLYPLVDSKPFQGRLRQVDTGERSREAIYTELLLWLWGIGILVAGYWLYRGYGFSLLGFTTANHWRFWASCIAALVVSLVYLVYILKLKGSAEDREKLRPQFEGNDESQLIPRNETELRLWWFCSISAAAEEVVFRGFALWYLGTLTNTVVAVTLSTVMYAVCHGYQGMAGVIRTGGLGLIMALVYVFSGSLWPAIVLHIAQDVFAGTAGYLCLTGKTREENSPG